MNINNGMKSELKAIILDDEQKSIDSLQWKVRSIPSSVEIRKTFTSAQKALSYLNGEDIDLIFLDIDMPEMSGIEFAKVLRDNKINAKIIFVTGHDEYILEALRLAAFDYLLKPVDPEDLKNALDRYFKDPPANNLNNLIAELYRHNKPSENEKIALPTSESILYIEKKSICYCASDSNYTGFYLSSGEKILIAKTLGKVEEMLGSGFIRIHNSFIINKEYVSAYHRGTGGSVKLNDGTILPVSKSRKEQVLDSLNK
ncbi:MAG: response regulator transcription factor [Saprospiraceae bacterium]|nr:response regulator transcription factor [Saprospiraceae bacterium]